MQIRQSDASDSLRGIYLCACECRKELNLVQLKKRKKKKEPVGAISELAAIFNHFTLESTCLCSEIGASFMPEEFGNKLGIS